MGSAVQQRNVHYSLTLPLRAFFTMHYVFYKSHAHQLATTGKLRMQYSYRMAQIFDGGNFDKCASGKF